MKATISIPLKQNSMRQLATFKRRLRIEPTFKNIGKQQLQQEHLMQKLQQQKQAVKMT